MAASSRETAAKKNNKEKGEKPGDIAASYNQYSA